MRRALGTWAVGLVLVGLLAAATRPLPVVLVASDGPAAATATTTTVVPSTTAGLTTTVVPTTLAPPTPTAPAPTTTSTAAATDDGPTTTPPPPPTTEPPQPPTSTIEVPAPNPLLATFAGLVRDGNGSPLGGVCIGAVWNGSTPGPILGRSAADGSYRVAIERPPWVAMVRPTVVECEDGELGGWELSTSAMQRPTGNPGDFDLSVSLVGRVAGRVVDEGGRPVAGVRVQSSSWPAAETGADGSYELVGVQPGPLTVLVRRPAVSVEVLVDQPRVTAPDLVLPV